MNNWKLILLIIAITWNIHTEAQPNPSTLADFEKLKMLVGEWQGTLPDGKPIEISYQEISGGAVVEIYHSSDPMWWNMSSAYHLNNDRIMMTHYCSWGNHPRMSAIPDKDKKTLKFDFIDIARTQPQNGYMHSLTFNFIGKDQLKHHWTWREKGKDTPLTLTLTRKYKVSHKTPLNTEPQAKVSAITTAKENRL